MKILDAVKKEDIPQIAEKEELKKLRAACATLSVNEAIELSDVAESQIYNIAKDLNKKYKYSKFKGIQRKINRNEYRTFILRIK